MPDWLREVVRPVWFERYGRRIEDYRLPKRREEREALALAIGTDGFTLLDALDAPGAPATAQMVPMVATLRDVWRIHYAREGDGPPRWRAGSELPPVGERLQSPYDPEAHYSTKRQMEWSGYKVRVAETCDEDVAHLVTPVLTCPAMQPSEAEQAYAQRHFAIDWEREQVTCPQGKTSVTWRGGHDEVGPHASRQCSAVPTAAPAPPGSCAARPRRRVAPSSSTRAPSTRR